MTQGPFQYRVVTEEDYYLAVTETTSEVLTAQFQHILLLEGREPENSNAPQEAAYLHLIEETVTEGLNIPPPPPPLAEDTSQLPTPVAQPHPFCHKQSS